MLSICQAELHGISRTERVTLGYLKMAKPLKEIRDSILPPTFGRKKKKKEEYFLLFVAHPEIFKIIIIRKIGNSFS